MKLLIGLGFQLGFVPIFHFPVLVPPTMPVKQFPVPSYEPAPRVDEDAENAHPRRTRQVGHS